MAGEHVNHTERFEATLAEAQREVDSARRWLDNARRVVADGKWDSAITDLVVAIHNLSLAVDALTRAQLNAAASAQEKHTDGRPA